jgi:succinate-acetate transporter protein
MKHKKITEGKHRIRDDKISSIDEGKDKVFAITALVCGLLFWVPLFNILLGALAIIFGLLAIRRVRENPDRYGGQGMAVVGLILGIISVLFTLLGVYVNVVHPELIAKFNVTGFSTALPK